MVFIIYKNVELLFLFTKLLYLCTAIQKKTTTMNVIVDNFYTNIEKLGLKTHTPTSTEIEYLSSLTNFDQCDAICQENSFSISRIKIKSELLIGLIFILVVLSIYLMFLNFTTFLYVLPLVVISILGLLVFFKRYLNKIEILTIENGIFKSAKKVKSENMFK